MAAMIRRPSAWLPVTIGLAAWAFVLVYAAAVGIQPAAQPHDEGTPARIFQLLLLLQGALILVFAARWLSRDPRWAAAIIALQLASAAVPIATILILES
jgi:hypothetical protein